MSKFILFFISFGLLVSCQSTKTKNRPINEKKSRHGWTVFSGPKRTVIGVSDSASIMRGKQVYTNHCSRCHGAKGKGDGSDAKKLKIKPANLAAFSKAKANYYLVFQINEGKGDMPQWKDIISTEESWDLSNYIQSLK